jgi:hypothetical protein
MGIQRRFVFSGGSYGGIVARDHVLEVSGNNVARKPGRSP